MRINEVEEAGADPKELMGLIQFLAGRADDTDARKEIDTATLISAAQSLGIPVTDATLPGFISQPPLNGVLEPMDPKKPGKIFFKGADIGPAKMTVPQAQQVVNKMAKSAMRRGMK
jgi:hypothetical protein